MFPLRRHSTSALLLGLLLAVAPVLRLHARPFTLSGASLDLQEVTTNVDVYYTSMRYNRAANEWDVAVTLSNKTSQAISGPMVLLVDSFTGTSGPLRTDGVSSNQVFFDLSAQLPQAALSPGSNSAPRTISLGFISDAEPKLTTQVYAAPSAGVLPALAFTRSLNGVGQPLPGVTIQETGPNLSDTNATEGTFGVATLGQAAGNYTWKFSLAGYLPVWRQAVLQSNTVQVIPYPRLAARNPQVFTLSPLSGGLLSNQTVQVQFSGGSFSQATQGQLTSLDGQSLPDFLPQGWSPLQAFWLELGSEPSQPGAATLVPAGPIGATESAVLARFDPTTLNWRVLQMLPGNGTNALAVSLPGSGAYALVVPDSSPGAPPAPTVGSALQPSGLAAPNPANLVAGPLMTPLSSAASSLPAQVTASADVLVTNVSGPLPSGTLLRGQVSERYLLQDGTTRVPPVFDHFVVGYQLPGGTPAGTLDAQFPLRPLLVLGPQQLNDALVHVDLFPPGAFGGVVLGTNGGLVSAEPVHLVAGAGVLQGEEAIQLRSVSATNFLDLPGTNVTPVAAFELGLSGVTPGQSLSLGVAGLATNALFVLGQVIDQVGLYGVTPLERLHSDSNGNLVSDEPAGGDHLPGITGSGQYVLLQEQAPQGLVEGIAKNSSGQAAGGLPVSIAGQPWLALSAPDGSFKLLSPAGAGALNVTELATGDSGAQAITMQTNLVTVTTSVTAGAGALEVSSITPADNATNVPVVAPVVVNFSRALNAATVEETNAVQLLDSSNQPVTATVNLDLTGTMVTVLPNATLQPGMQFTVLLSTNLQDTIGRPLEGQNQFTFSTVPASVRSPAAQLIIYQPGATNIPTNIVAELPGFTPGTNQSLIVVSGTEGSADPGVPVIVMNEGSGETTTVTSKPDGSFNTFIAGQEQDFISATFISLNGARIYMPVNRQLFDDGSVGLYSQGGSLTAQGDGGPIQITVPPNAIQTRTKFKLQSLTTNELSMQLGGVVPTNSTVAGSALNLHVEGDAPKLPLHVSFPVDLTALDYPTNEAPTNAAAMVAVVQTNQDVTTFQVVDQLVFIPQQSATPGVLKRRVPKGSGSNAGAAEGILNSELGFVLASAGPAGLAAQVTFNQVLVPLLFGPRPVVIKGYVSSIPLDIAAQPSWGSLANQLLNYQSGNQLIDVPLQVAQLFGLPTPSSLLGSAGNLIQTSVQVSAQILKAKEQELATPLSGAFITVSQIGGPLNNEPGRLFPGMVYATSGADGRFLTVAPAALGYYNVTATHPLFSQVLSVPVLPISAIPGQQGQLGLAGAVFENFFFQVPISSQTPPTVSIANLPVQPAAKQTCQLVINASQPLAPPRIGVKITVVGSTNLLTGRFEPVVNLSPLTNIVKTTTGNNSQWTGTFSVDQPVAVSLEVVIQGQNGYQDDIIPYVVGFTGPQPPVPISNIPRPDTNDIHGPLVVETEPFNNGFVGENDQIVVSFNKPIDAYVTNHLGGITLSAKGSSAIPQVLPIVQLAPGQQTLSLQFPGLPADSTFQLTLSGQSIRDLAGQPLNQVPSSPTPQSFTMIFRTLPSVSTNLPGLVNGKGVVISGTQLYAIDQAPQGNFLDAYNITIPSQPQLESQLRLLGMPRDLTVIPHFRYKVNAQAPVVTNDLVAVVGGDLDAQINQAQGTTVSVPGQYLWVVNMGNPQSPQVLASPIVSFRVGSAVTKVRWAPPYLVYEEFGADIQQLGFVNLAEMIFGFGSPLVQQEAFPVNGRSGLDLNGDGDYVDPGETNPIPPLRPAEFYGKHQSYVLAGTTQKILDFSVTPGGRTVGVTLTTGGLLDTNNNVIANLPAMYRTFVFNTLPLDISTPTNAMFAFGPGAYPRWVSVFDSLTILSNDVPTTISAALVSLEPDTNGLQTLAVLDISLPLHPQLLNKVVLPTSLLGGNIESVSEGADGLLQVAGSQNLVILNPLLLGVANVPPGQLSPAIVKVIPNAGGTTRSLGSSDFGVFAVADSGRTEVIQTPPELQFVSFPRGSTLVDPTTLNRQSDAALLQLFSSRNELNGLAPAKAQADTNLLINSDLEPPNPALHYHVLMFAPGGSGPMIDLGMESLSPGGRPLVNLGGSFAPVRAVSASAQQATGEMPRPCGAPIRALSAYRVSNDPNSPFYNWYLSRPFALITEAVAPDDLVRIKGDGGVDREILFSGAELRAFIDPDEATNAVLSSFAGQIDPQLQIIDPSALATLPAVNRDYLLGDNPPPPGGSTPMEDTYGAIQAHSGELRTSDIDMALPSPRLPINVVRSIGNQDNYEGPFGVGWDFNYNQRLTVLDPLTFPAGLQLPLVVRDNSGDSEIAGSQDILFNTGEGQVYHFIWQGTNMPAEYAQDPLVQQFDYKDMVSDYYLPEHGLFDLLVKYGDGRFERLTPSGVRYRYRPDGRLETVLDRYPENRLELQYDLNGWLWRIDDASVSAPRYVEFGHYCRQTDRDFKPSLDTDTDDPYLQGKISQLVDYAGRNVLFQYSPDGFLTNRLGVQVDGENGGYAGRSHTYYSYDNCKLTGISSTVAGTPVISSINAISGDGKPVAQSASGSYGSDQFSIPVNNSAATLGSEATAVTMGDGTAVQRKFDLWGNVSSVTVSGTNGPPATTIYTNTPDGLVLFVQHPEGNSETLTYDNANPNLRSRGNLLSIKVDPGPRGGRGYTESFQYDPRYNLKSGIQINADGFPVTYTLTSDGRDVASVDYDGAGTQTETYNSNGQMTDRVDVNGVEHSVTYDPASGFILNESEGANTYDFNYDGSVASQLGKPASVAPPLGQPTDYSYNANLQPVQVARGDLVGTSAYDELGRLIYHEEQVGDGKVWSLTRAYDDKGFMTNSVLNGIEVNGAETSLSTTYIPDVHQRVQSIIQPNGTVQTFAYDNRGNITEATVGDFTNAYSYDLNNNATEVFQGGDLVRTIQYDGLDRATNILRHTGTEDYQDTRSYYPGGALQSDTESDPQFGVARQLTYDQIDALGRRLSATRHGKIISPQYQYSYGALSSGITGPRMASTSTWDSAGNQTAYKDPNLTMVIQNDGNGRPTEIDNQEVGATYKLLFGYDGLDHETNLADVAGTMFSYVPRADGHFIQITDARTNVTTLDYTSIGEFLRKTRADGMEVDYRHDAERQLVYQGDPAKGFNYGYDTDLRLTNSTLRDGASLTYQNFDPRNLPTTINFPGGSATLTYDLQRQLLQRKVSYQSTTWEEDYSYDAVGRVRAETYLQNGGAQNTATFDYDPAGPLTAAHFNEDNQNFAVGYGYYDDGARKSITYPSGISVTEVRDGTGRLTGVTDGAGNNVINVVSWKGNSQPAVAQLDKTMQIVNTYDQRGRLTGSRVTRLSDGAVLVHTRYQYDAANNVQVRQFLNRNAKADNLSYDSAERLNRAQVGTVPLVSGGFATPLYDRSYDYHSNGLDYLTATSLATNLTLDIPPFATNWPSHDNFLLATEVDGFNRGPADPMGNVAQAQLWGRTDGATSPEPVAASLQHDGFHRLVAITLTNGLTIENEYQPGGLRFARKVLENGQVISASAYVYDNLSRLLEEYEVTNSQRVLVGRYYYAASDSPAAADLLDPASGQLRRYYLLKDASQSVLAVADTNGTVVERIWYDPYGQPMIQGQDTAGPKLQTVAQAPDGKSLLIGFSEPVWPATNDPGPGGGIVQVPPPPTNGIITVSALSTLIPGSAVLLPAMTNYAPYSVLQFTNFIKYPTLSPVKLVGWWPADGTAQDVKKNDNGVLEGGVTFGPGLIGEAFVLNGTTAFVEVPSSSSLNMGTNDFTASLWVNFNDPAGEQAIIEKWADPGPSGWSLLKMPNNSLRFAVGEGKGKEVNVDTVALPSPETNWIHYAVRRQAGQLGVFTNGVSVPLVPHLTVLLDYNIFGTNGALAAQASTNFTFAAVPGTVDPMKWSVTNSDGNVNSYSNSVTFGSSDAQLSLSYTVTNANGMFDGAGTLRPPIDVPLTDGTNSFIWTALSSPVTNNGVSLIATNQFSATFIVSSNSISPANVNNSSPLLFGSRGGTNFFLNGSIDEVTLYSRALSDAELTAVAGGVQVPGQISVTLNAGTVADEWGNTNIGETIFFQTYSNNPSLVYYSAEPAPNTAPPQLARSALGLPFLFQGQYFDYDAGLLYLRARFYDPFSGMFFEPDPQGYEDSVNAYAGLGNNPTSRRDPSGLSVEEPSGFHPAFERSLGEQDFNENEQALFHNNYEQAARLGLAAHEFASLNRAGFLYMRENLRVEFLLRKFHNADMRYVQFSKGFQGKEEEISEKTEEATALTKWNGRSGEFPRTGDVDGLGVLINGDPTAMSEYTRIAKVSNEMIARLSPEWRALREKFGLENINGEQQRIIQHGASLNLPQERALADPAHPLLYTTIEGKLQHGLGDAFSLTFDPRNGLIINENLDVQNVVQKYSDYYDNYENNVNGFNAELFEKFNAAARREGDTSGLWFPKSFLLPR